MLRISLYEITINFCKSSLIQAVFGSLEVLEHSLQNDAQKIMRSGEKISKCLLEYLESPDFIQVHPKAYSALLSANILAKCFHTRLWENSKHVARQLPGIGITSSAQLVMAKKTSFDAILEANPRDLERVCKIFKTKCVVCNYFIRYWGKNHHKEIIFKIWWGTYRNIYCKCLTRKKKMVWKLDSLLRLQMRRILKKNALWIKIVIWCCWSVILLIIFIFTRSIATIICCKMGKYKKRLKVAVQKNTKLAYTL